MDLPLPFMIWLDLTGAVGFGNYPGVVESNLGSCGNYVGVAATIFGVAQF
jgi:hypothetical protein